jgi:hypothetical protein
MVYYSVAPGFCARSCRFFNYGESVEGEGEGAIIASPLLDGGCDLNNNARAAMIGNKASKRMLCSSTWENCTPLLRDESVTRY